MAKWVPTMTGFEISLGLKTSWIFDLHAYGSPNNLRRHHATLAAATFFKSAETCRNAGKWCKMMTRATVCIEALTTENLTAFYFSLSWFLLFYSCHLSLPYVLNWKLFTFPTHLDICEVITKNSGPIVKREVIRQPCGWTAVHVICQLMCCT